MQYFFPPLSLLMAWGLALPQQGGDQADPIRLGRPVQSVEVPAWHRSSIAFSPDGKKLAMITAPACRRVQRRRLFSAVIPIPGLDCRGELRGSRRRAARAG